MKRLLTGIALMVVGVYVLSVGGLPLIVFLSVVGALAFYEVKLITELNSPYLMVSNMVSYVCLMALIYVYRVEVTMGYFIPVVCFFCIYLYEFYCRKLVFRSRPFLNNLKYFCYVYFGFSSVYFIHQFPNGLQYIVFMFLSIWATDVFAYYGGRLLGRTPLCKVSPKKTVEGTVSGVAVAALLVAVICYFYGYSWFFVLGAIAIGGLAQLGDLYESLIKRVYNVKDSSNLLPGHGGILDRADSTLFVAPILYMAMAFFL